MRPLQAEIIDNFKVSPQINPAEEVRRSVDFLKEYLLTHQGLESLVLGISGGQDSTLAGKLAQIAVEELRAETGSQAYKFIGLQLPYDEQTDEADALAAVDYIQPDLVLEINIKAATDGIEAEISKAGVEITDYNKGNVKARQRMVVQYAVAAHYKGAVIGTDHAAESVTGFFTKFGDGAADILPLWRLNKSQGKELLKYLQSPAALYEKIPTADLEDDRPMLSDEEALGVSYQAIDAYLTGQEVAEEDAEKIESWYLKTKHKRHLPITIYDDFWRK